MPTRDPDRFVVGERVVLPGGVTGVVTARHVIHGLVRYTVAGRVYPATDLRRLPARSRS